MLMRFFTALCTLLLGITLLQAEQRSVRDFGAVGDGKADDTAAIQKAVDSGVGNVVFPKGVYRISKTISIELDKTGFTSLTSDGTASIVMENAGPALHFIGTHEGSADPGQFKANVWEKQRMPIVRGLEIRGTHPEANGIEVTGVMQMTITETRVQFVRHAVHLTTRNRNVIISNCHFYQNSGCGVFYDHVNLHQSNIIGCHISYNAGGGIVFRGGDVRNVHIGTCDIESNMTADAPATANVLIDSAGGSTAEVAITGCTIQHNSKSPDSANVRIIGKGKTTAKNDKPTQEGHVTISGNVFSDVAVNIHLDHARGVVITGNTFWEGFEHDLLVENSQNILIGSNNFDRNPRYVVNGNWGKEKNGMVFRNTADSKLSSSIIKGVWYKDAAVLLESCQRFTITDCSILDNDGSALVLQDCNDTKVSDCIIRDDRPAAEKENRPTGPALKVAGGADNWITSNMIKGTVEVAGDSAMQDGNKRLEH